jgi:hypothetical protein
MKEVRKRMLGRDENELPNCESYRKRKNLNRKRRNGSLDGRPTEVEDPSTAVGVKILRVAVAPVHTDRNN